MQFKSIALLALAALLSTGAMAQKAKKNKPGRKPAASSIVLVPKYKAVPADSFSYAAGVYQSRSLKDFLVQREGVDSAYLGDVVRGLKDTSSEAEQKRQIAYVAGLKIAQMNKTTVLAAINEQAAGKKGAEFTDVKRFTDGLADGLMHTATLSSSEAQALFERQLEYAKEQTRIANEAFLLANAKKPGVKTTASGLQYRILTEGKGKVAADTSNVEVNYEGKLIDGTVFDSSYQRGQTATFKPGQVIKGWTEALKMMPEGSVWELTIPAALGYGDRPSGPIPAGSTLVFKVEVVKVK